MKNLCYLLVSTLVLSGASILLLAQGTKSNIDFVIDVNRPFVYVKFDHIASGPKRFENDSESRIWLHLINNSRVPITVKANGLADDSPKDEVGLRYDVVRDRELNVVVLFTPTDSDKSKAASDKDSTDSVAKNDEMPVWNNVDVASVITIGSGEGILFSIPINHLGKKWHVEIPFDFKVPVGKGPRNSNEGGQPVMVVEYSLWDLPPQSRTEIFKK